MLYILSFTLDVNYAKSTRVCSKIAFFSGAINDADGSSQYTASGVGLLIGDQFARKA
jgi:hypothetical protein